MLMENKASIKILDTLKDMNVKLFQNTRQNSMFKITQKNKPICV